LLRIGMPLKALPQNLRAKAELPAFFVFERALAQ
jgi:hypothetical protein